MKTEITNKRTMIDVESIGYDLELSLRGSATFSKEGEVLSFSGGFYNEENEEEYLGSFSYSSSPERISQSMDIEAIYKEEASELLAGTLEEIRKQND